MTPETLSRIGATLYGPAWKIALASALGLNYKLLQRFLTGGYAVLPYDTRPKLIELCNERIREIEGVKAELENMR